MWPTPTQREYKGGRKPETLAAKGRLPSNTLSDAVMWRTPQAGDYRSPNLNPGARGTSEFLLQSARALPAQAGGKLNAAWVLRLMGFPDGWLDL